MRVRDLLSEPYRIHDVPSALRVERRDLLEPVELAGEHAGQVPARAVGGHARRVNSARAIALRPRL